MDSPGGWPRILSIVSLILAGIAMSSAVPATAESRQPVTLVDLGTAGASTSVALDVNNRGKIAGNASEPSTGASTPVAWLPHTADPPAARAAALAPSGRAVQINDRDQIIGALDEQGSTHAVLWDRHGQATVIHPEALFSAAVDLNDRGDVLVWYAGEDAQHRASLWHRGDETPVLPATTGPGGPRPLPDLNLRPVAFNSRGEVAITAQDRSGAPAAAYHWFDGRLTDIGSLGGDRTTAVAIDEHGWIVGTSTNPAGEERAFIWQNDHMQDLGTLGGPSSRVVAADAAMSNAGHVVGTSTNPAGEERAFIWQNGHMQDLGTLGGADVEPVGVNDRGQVAGQSLTGHGEQHAFYWDGERGMVDLGTLGGSISRAYGLDERGRVVGVSSTETGEHRAVLWVVKGKR